MSTFTITIQSLIRQHGLNVLVDTCGGNDKERVRPHFHRQSRPWLDTLRAAGVRPEEIDVVLCTHLHVDHVGWNTRLENGRWVPTFPNARYLIAQREWDFWRNASPAALQRTGDFLADSVLPIIESGQADMIGDQHALPATYRSSLRTATHRARRCCGSGLGRAGGAVDRRPHASPVADPLLGVERAVPHRSG